MTRIQVPAAILAIVALLQIADTASGEDKAVAWASWRLTTGDPVSQIVYRSEDNKAYYQICYRGNPKKIYRVGLVIDGKLLDTRRNEGPFLNQGGCVIVYGSNIALKLIDDYQTPPVIGDVTGGYRVLHEPQQDTEKLFSMTWKGSWFIAGGVKSKAEKSKDEATYLHKWFPIFHTPSGEEEFLRFCYTQAWLGDRPWEAGPIEPRYVNWRDTEHTIRLALIKEVQGNSVVYATGDPKDPDPAKAAAALLSPFNCTDFDAKLLYGIRITSPGHPSTYKNPVYQVQGNVLLLKREEVE